MKKSLARYARSLGFERFGVSSAEPLKREQAFLANWVAEGRAGEMEYMTREPARRADPTANLPEARSVISVAMNYFVADSDRPPGEGKIARYARGQDYHRIIGKRLDAFVRYLEALAPTEKHRTFVDTGPLLERAFAQRAGLGFVGKNTMLITKGLGSWVFLATVVTSAGLEADAPDMRHCGDCRLCIDACPTQAITAPFELDARRCLSYLTIEMKGSIPEEFREKNESWIFGCDICQEVCPHNTRIPETSVSAFLPRKESSLSLREILELDEAKFNQLFSGTPLKRTGHEGLLRNACLAAAALKKADLLPQLQSLARDSSSSIIRDHAEWAVCALSQYEAQLTSL